MRYHLQHPTQSAACGTNHTALTLGLETWRAKPDHLRCKRCAKVQAALCARQASWPNDRFLARISRTLVDTERMSRQELLDQLNQAAKRVEGWPDWKRTMFERTDRAEQFFAETADAAESGSRFLDERASE